MKKFFLLQIVMLIIAGPAFSATYMMVTPEELDLQIPSHAVMWQEKEKKNIKTEAFFSCDENSAKLSTIHLDHFFPNVDSCEKMQIMLRLATPQCPLQVTTDKFTEKITSFRLECDRLKL